MNATLKRELRDRARDAYMDEFEREHGPITAEEQVEVDAAWARAAEKEARWRAAHGK